MKKYFLFIITVFLTFSACKEMDSEYKDYVVANGYTYPQKADSLKIYPGYNRLRLKWHKPKSPTVKYAMVYWNNYEDSLKVEWDDDKDSIFINIEDLEETSHTFYIKNFDMDGNISLPVDITGTPYGEAYLSSMTDRSFIEATRDENYFGNIKWGAKTTDLAFTEVRYVARDGSKRIKRINFDEESINLPDIKPGELFDYRSFFVPDNGIDTIAGDWKTADNSFVYKIPRLQWSATTRKGNHPWGDGGGGMPELIFDGNMSTGWHSSVGAPLPQVVAVDMKSVNEIEGIIIYPPAQTNWRYLNNVEVYVSDNQLLAEEPNESWGKPVATASYTGGNSFNIKFDSPVKGQYMAIVFLNSTSGNTYISFMELEAYSK